MREQSAQSSHGGMSSGLIEFGGEWNAHCCPCLLEKSVNPAEKTASPIPMFQLGKSSQFQEEDNQGWP